MAQKSDERNTESDSDHEDQPPEKKLKSDPQPLTNGLETRKKRRKKKKKQTEQINGKVTILKAIPQVTAAPIVVVNPLFEDPHIIPPDGTLALDECDWISPPLHSKLERHRLSTLFPVQSHVASHILHTQENFQYNDVCVSAPTGSGKTLAYVLPIIQNLVNSQHFQAIVLVPTRELAVQVHRVFKAYLPEDLRAELATTSQDFREEQRSICRDLYANGCIMPQVLVATPGRLIDHMRKTKKFFLGGVRFLVLDEADRLLAGLGDRFRIETIQKAITSEWARTFLFSATLFQDIDLLDKVTLKEPKLFTYQGPIKECAVTTPLGLEEFYVTTTLENRALTLHTLIKSKEMKKVLCFVRSKDDCHRLAHILKSMGGIGRIGEFSAELGKKKRKSVFRDFADGSINVLVASALMERGIDLNVQYVLLYSPPDNITDYIHEVGRTARAGGTGTAITLTTVQESKDFFKMMKKANKTLTPIALDSKVLDEAEPQFEKAIENLTTKLKEEKRRKFKVK